MKPTVVAFTGASGILYGVRLVRALLEVQRPVALIISEAARLVIREELGISMKSYTNREALSELLGCETKLLSAYAPKDFSAPVASGSYPTEGMIIVPCSMGTLGAVASAVSQNLIHRAADCTLKEGRRLILVPRETPLSALHLENMLKLARLGVRIVPAMPGFYSGAQGLQEIVDFMAGKILDQMEIPHALYPRWTGSLTPHENA
ncbi:MAG: UbiX family flavin prenyltransferase [Candidatus Omnitrophica bacterium]|nr:UbiX family flavin prenyltransferase [Candidatus Omnitrophota bacterium]